MNISDSFLWQVAAVELILLLLGWSFLLLHGFRAGLRRAREHELRPVRDLLADATLSRSITDAGRATLHGLRRSEQRASFAVLALNLRGKEREWLGGLAADVGLVEHGVTLCQSAFWWRRLEGARLLTLLGAGGNTVLEMAGDPHPLVRSQVAVWCGTNPSSSAVKTLVGMLGDPSQASRFAVQDALVRLAELGADEVAEELERVREETPARTALAVAYAVADNRMAGPVARLTEHGSPEVRAAAYRALGRTGGAGGGGGDRLERGLADPVAAVRAAAAMAMGEVGRWQGGRLVVRLLRDPSWDVRFAAGRSLLLMGPPGELLLRRAAGHDDLFISDMARHTLDVAAVIEGRS